MVLREWEPLLQNLLGFKIKSKPLYEEIPFTGHYLKTVFRNIACSSLLTGSIWVVIDLSIQDRYLFFWKFLEAAHVQHPLVSYLNIQLLINQDVILKYYQILFPN